MNRRKCTVRRKLLQHVAERRWLSVSSEIKILQQYRSCTIITDFHLKLCWCFYSVQSDNMISHRYHSATMVSPLTICDSQIDTLLLTAFATPFKILLRQSGAVEPWHGPPIGLLNNAFQRICRSGKVKDACSMPCTPIGVLLSTESRSIEG